MVARARDMCAGLPIKFRVAHEYAAFLHGHLSDILNPLEKPQEASQFFWVPFMARTPQEASEFNRLPQGNCRIEWLESHGYGQVARDVTYRAAIWLVLRDFNDFVATALEAMGKGRHFVALALLRKPFQDNLFYLEWAFADRSDFLDTYVNGGPDQLEKRRGDEQFRKCVADRSVKGVRKSDNYTVNMIQDWRYDKSRADSLASMADSALHLVTTRNPVIRTQPRSFNIGLRTEDVSDETWRNLYYHIVLMLFHAIDLMQAILQPVAPREHGCLTASGLQRRAGLMLFADSLLGRTELVPEFAAHIAVALPDACPSCKSRLSVDESLVKEIYERGGVFCPACGEELEPTGADTP